MAFRSLPPSRTVSGILLLSLFAVVQPQSLRRRGGARNGATIDIGSGTLQAGNGGNVTGSGSADGGNIVIGADGDSTVEIGGSNLTTGTTGRTASASASQSQVDTASISQSGLNNGAVIGIVAAMSIVATCVMLTLFLYVKRRRSRAAMARADSFKALRDGSEISISYPDPMLSSNRNGNGTQSEPEMQEGTRRLANSSSVTPESSIRFAAMELFAPPSRPRHEDINGAVTAEEILRELRNDDRIVSAPDGHAGDDFDCQRYSLPHSASSGSTLPPSYSSNFGEA